MHILVTNDDGIASEGLWRLAAALQAAGLGTVTVVAPEEEQSGTSMALPQRRETHLRSIEPPALAQGIAAFAFGGTPVGCVTAGMLAGVCPRPDAVVAGINRGLNSGTNVMLSGTVGAAMIGALWGLPAMAVSLQFVGDAPMPWPTAAWAAVQLFPLLGALAERGPLVLNVNVPHLHERHEVRGFRQTALSGFFFGGALDLELDPASDERGRQEVHFRFRRERVPAFPDSVDDGAVRAGFVSVSVLTPIAARSDIDLSAPLAGLAN